MAHSIFYRVKITFINATIITKLILVDRLFLNDNDYQIEIGYHSSKDTMKIPDREDGSESEKKRDSATQYPLINSQQLLGTTGILLIQHQDQQYQLRITKAGKLILTK